MFSFIDYIDSVYATIFFTLKKIFIYLFAVIGALFTPVQGLVGTVVFAAFLASTLSVYVSIKTKQGKKSVPDILFILIIKIFFYSGSILLSHKMDANIFEGNINGIPYALSKGATLLILYIEFKYMDESQMKLGNRSIWVLIGELFKKIKNIKKNLNDKTSENEAN